VTVEARLASSADGAAPLLCLGVIDTGAGALPHALEARSRDRVGLSNIERRLERYYGAAASLRIHSEPGRGTTAEVRLPFVAAEVDRALEMAS
jgi:sensor histidine kinase YesM